MVTATESCLPNSDTIFQCRNDDGVREEYYTQLLRKTGQHNHNIAVGDIYAIRDMEEGTKSLPFLKDVKSVFGQVLALCVKKEAVGRNSYHVVVRRLARWKSEAPNFATKKALKRAEKAGYFRPDQALLETMKVETHCVSDILRADIRLVDSKKFIDTDRIPVEWHQDTEAWDVSLCCPCRIDETDTVHDVRVDWNNYESCRTTTASNSDASSSIPKALMRGWQLLTIKGLEEALKSGWTGRLGAVFSVEQDTLPKPVEQQLPSSKNKKRKSKEVMPGATSLSVPSKKKKKTNQRVHFASMSRSSQQYTDCTTATETSIESPKTIGNSVASVPLHPTPLGDPVFTTSAKASSSIVYVEGVEMDVDEATVVADRKRKKPKRRWQFHVGDLVILRCDEAHPPKSPFVAKKPAWFPFKVRWSVAQIVAMYYRKGNESDFKMQVRWFYRPDELNEAVQKHLTDEQTVEFFDGKDESRMLVEVDEHVNEVPVESAVGHANLTSEVRPSRQWLRVNTKAAVPEVGFICRYAYMSENDDPRLYSVHDWTGYGISSSGPLYRGLSCPKCVTGTTPKLYQRYKTRLCTRLKIDGLQVSDVVREQRDTEKLAMEWSEVEFGCARASCKPADCCHGDNQQEFFSSVNIQIVKERCDARGTAKKSEYQEVKVSIGDFVCITSTFEVVVRTQIDLAGNRERNRWFPYKGPFVYVQVLSIFRKSDTRSNAVMLEVRRFLRRSEVTSIATKYLPPDCARQHEEEVFESFEVEVIPAGRVLGIAEMFLGHHTESCRTLTTDRPLLQNEIPQPKCRCTFFLTAVALQKLFCADSTPLKWTRRMLQRGLGASKLIQSDSELAASIEFCLGISIGSGKNDSNNLFMGLIQEAKKSAPASLPLFKKAVGEASEHSIFSSVSIEIPWSRYSEADRLCSARDRKDCWWKICVGDAIAIRKEGAAGRPSLYTSNWEPAQVLAIRSSDSRNGTYEFVVQRLRRSVTAPSKHSFPDRVSDAIGNSASVLLASDLIGPVYATKENHITSVWGSKAVPYLPTNVVVYESMAQFSFSAFVRKALECTSLYTRQELRLLYDALEGELIDFSAQDESLDPLPQTLSSSASDLMAPTAKDLFYTDRNGVRYYKRLILEPSMYNIVEEIRAGRDRVDGPWSVELGDAVVVEYSHGYGEAKFGGSLCSTQGRRTKSFPFVKPWGIGEVVSIFVPKQMADSDEISIEIELRWYYRAPEIKGAVAVLDQSSYNVCEEVFESDHYDSCSASSLRGPALVHEKPTSLGRRRLHLGMPVLEFSSSRFWSPRRSSLVPIESSELARIQRGRLHSPRIMKDAELRNALETLGGLTLQDSPSKRKNWRSNFHDAIQKLSLTDASKEGFKSSKAIIGRDKEMSQILSFLRTALKGNNKDGRCSLFIAGPPGVGKTACVRAAICELEQLRSKSQVPSFDFVCMNGMEMRYPFEAYIHLWEKISGITLRPEVAASRLEAYFTKDECTATKEAKSDSRSVVVLLDEIDYLVTKNQSVLYNFFDWPTHNQRRRLIVLGVSNTLNLAEQLHTRVQSRIGSRRCIFKAYDAKQIENILRAKLAQATPGQTVFDQDAIVFVSKKTASLSGDIRRAFQICRTAAEHVVRENSSTTATTGARDQEDEADPIVTIRDAVKVSRESFNSAKSQAITRCSSFESLLLVTLASLSKSTGREFGGFDMEEILVKMEALANGLGDTRYIPAPTLGEAMQVVCRLAEGNIVSVVTPKSTSLTYRSSLAGSGGPWPLVSLTVDDLSVLLALKKSPHKALALKYLGLGAF